MSEYGVTLKDLKQVVENYRQSPDVNFPNTMNEIGGSEGLMQKLKTTADGGIRVDSMESRQEAFGPNSMPVKPPPTYLELCWEALQDATLVMLIIAAVVSLVLGFAFEEDKSTAWVEGVAILVAVVVVVNVTAGNDYVKGLQFAALKQKLLDTTEVTVTRTSKSGTPKQLQIPAPDIVVGDVVLLSEGMIVGVDGFVITADKLNMDESALTGEPTPLEKNPTDHPIIVSGTKVCQGTGSMFVVAVGEHSVTGQIKKLVVQGHEGPAEAAAPAAGAGAGAGAGAAANDVEVGLEEEEAEDELTGRSVLAAKLDKLALDIGKLGGVVAMACVLIMLVKFFVKHFGINGETSWDDDYYSEILKIFVTGITILVVAIPEGLPLAVTLSLAFSGRRMEKDNCMVKHLDSCETMGSATTICSDKTGTLTQNRMTVVAGHFLGAGLDKAASFTDAHPDAFRQALCETISLNVNPTTRVFRPDEVPEEGEKEAGNPTEMGLLSWLIKAANFNNQSVLTRPLYQNKLCSFPFSSSRKRGSLVVPVSDDSWDFEEQGMLDTDVEAKGEGGQRYRCLMKGASEKIVERCTRTLAVEGGRVVAVEFTQELKDQVNQVITNYAHQAYRTLSFSYRNFTAGDFEGDTPEDDFAENNHVFMGFVGIQDPVRPEVPEALRKCRRAQISVMMVTGDHLDTAVAIAKQCSILDDDGRFDAMEGAAFREAVLNSDGSLNQAKFDAIWPTLRVLARSSPEDKLTLVTGLQNSGLYRVYRDNPVAWGDRPPIYKDRQVIAVTGDGTNDAPALSKSDVGFSMKESTEICKDASDIVLLTSDFANIVSAVKWGRNVYDSVAKFLQFQLTVNIAAIVIASVGAIWLNRSPLQPVQMLWVNLIMDSFASLALATEPPHERLLDRAPYGRNKAMISRQMWFNMLGHSVYQLIVIMVMLVDGHNLFDVPDGRFTDHNDPPTKHFTIIFNTFVLMQLFNEFNSRKLYGEWNVFEGLANNAIFLIIVIGTVGAQIIIVQFGGRAFTCEALSAEQWGWCILFGFLELPWQFVVNLVVEELPEDFMEQTEYTPAEKDDGADVEVVDPNVPIRQAPTPALGQTRTASGKLATSHRGQALGKYQQTFSSRGEAKEAKVIQQISQRSGLGL